MKNVNGFLISNGGVLRVEDDPHDPAVADILIEGSHMAAVGLDLRKSLAHADSERYRGHRHFRQVGGAGVHQRPLPFP